MGNKPQGADLMKKLGIVCKLATVVMFVSFFVLLTYSPAFSKGKKTFSPQEIQGTYEIKMNSTCFTPQGYKNWVREDWEREIVFYKETAEGVYIFLLNPYEYEGTLFADGILTMSNEAGTHYVSLQYQKRKHDFNLFDLGFSESTTLKIRNKKKGVILKTEWPGNASGGLSKLQWNCKVKRKMTRTGDSTYDLSKNKLPLQIHEGSLKSYESNILN